MKTPKINSVTALQKYKLHVAFDDGTEGNYSVSHLAGRGVFKSWDVENNFFRVLVSKESGAITWPEDLDIDTIQVYCEMKGIPA